MVCLLRTASMASKQMLSSRSVAPTSRFFQQNRSHFENNTIPSLTTAFRSCSIIQERSFVSSQKTEPEKNEYVHPLSQIVLEHFQNNKHDWVVKMGLDRGLSFHRDGTFELKFPSFDKDKSKIWTSYDPQEKKHWLTVHKGDLVGRFLLQDNLKPAWHSDARSLPDRITDAVDELIEKIDEKEDPSQGEAK